MLAPHVHETPISHHPCDKSSWNTLHGKTIHINYTVRKQNINDQIYVHIVAAICSSLFPAHFIEMLTKRYHDKKHVRWLRAVLG